MIKFYIETYGCAMNEYDSLLAQKILEENNSQKVDSFEEADIILLNTCAVRENAENRIINRVESFGHLKKKGKKIGVLGCLSQNLKEELFDRSPYVDFILGPDNLRDLKAIVVKMLDYKLALKQKNKQAILKEQKNKLAFLELSKTETYEDLLPSVKQHFEAGKNKITGFVSIQRGCDNFCTFCVVPYTRGRERSRSIESILEEVKMLADNNFQSIVLLGQNVNSYNYKNKNFTFLIEQVLQKTNISRIYFMSPHPKDFPIELIELMVNNDRFPNQIHLPLQSGSDRILKLMKRDYNQREYLDLVFLMKKKVPNLVITTDIITGFSSETDKDHEDTMFVLKEAQFDSAFMFMYSERKGTVAQKKHPDDVLEEVKKKRLQEIIDLQLQISRQKNEQYIDKKVIVLAESVSKKNSDELMGTISNGKKVIFPMQKKNLNFSNYLGKEFEIIIDDVTSNTLKGRLVN